MRLTLSVIKADIGGYVGHSESHPDILTKARERMDKAKKQGLLGFTAEVIADNRPMLNLFEKTFNNIERHRNAELYKLTMMFEQR